MPFPVTAFAQQVAVATGRNPNDVAHYLMTDAKINYCSGPGGFGKGSPVQTQKEIECVRTYMNNKWGSRAGGKLVKKSKKRRNTHKRRRHARTVKHRR